MPWSISFFGGNIKKHIYEIRNGKSNFDFSYTYLLSGFLKGSNFVGNFILLHIPTFWRVSKRSSAGVLYFFSIKVKLKVLTETKALQFWIVKKNPEGVKVENCK